MKNCQINSLEYYFTTTLSQPAKQTTNLHQKLYFFLTTIKALTENTNTKPSDCDKDKPLAVQGGEYKTTLHNVTLFFPDLQSVSEYETGS